MLWGHAGTVHTHFTKNVAEQQILSDCGGGRQN